MQKNILRFLRNMLTSKSSIFFIGFPIIKRMSRYMKRHKRLTSVLLLVFTFLFFYFNVSTDKRDMILSNLQKINIENNSIENIINKADELLNITENQESLIKNIKQDYDNQPKMQYAYSGKPHIIIGKAEFTIKRQNGIQYGEPDRLNRPTWASALITKKLIQKEKNEKRQEIKIKPCGWPKKNPKVKLKYHDGTNYFGYFWNRSHMIADFMGSDAIYNNLITGTREQNVGSRKNDKGMAYLETKIRKYYKKHNKNIFYTVENIYHKDEIIPRYSIVNALSDDKKINERVIVFNSANNYRIDYYTGDIKKGE